MDRFIFLIIQLYCFASFIGFGEFKKACQEIDHCYVELDADLIVCDELKPSYDLKNYLDCIDFNFVSIGSIYFQLKKMKYWMRISFIWWIFIQNYKF